MLVFDVSGFYVNKTKTSYEVVTPGITCGIVDSAYTLDYDGLSIAITRCLYLVKQWASKVSKEELCRAMVRADNEYQFALEEKFGSNAGDMRYSRHPSGSNLWALSKAHHTLSKVYFDRFGN
jgi:hypothetical protein